MRKLFFTFFILLIAVGLGFFIQQHPGSVVVSFQHWMITTSVWVAALVEILLFLLMYAGIRLIKNIASIPSVLARRRLLSHAQKYQKYITAGISALAAGEFSRAEKYFTHASQYNASFLGFLLAAKAAQEQQDYATRDEYLEKALSANDRNNFAIEIAQAQFYLQSNQLDDALFILKKWYKLHPKNRVILSGLQQIFTHNHDTVSLDAIMPQLKKSGLRIR